MRENDPRADLARRIAKALRRYGGFVYEDDIDKHSLVMDVIREAGVNLVLSVAQLSPQKKIYAIVPLDRRCRVSCTASCNDEEPCFEECMNKCRKEIITKVSEALEKFAERITRH